MSQHENEAWREGGAWVMRDSERNIRSFHEARRPEPGQAELKPNGWDNPRIRLLGEIEERELPIGPDREIQPAKGCPITDLGTGSEIAFRSMEGLEGIRHTELIGLEEI